MYQPQNEPALHTLRILNVVTGGASRTLALLLAVTLCFTSITAVAQDRSWQVDPQYSFARLSLGSGVQSQGIDVSPVSGKVVFDSSDPADLAVDLNFKPASGFGQEYSEISFRSKRAEITRDGTLAVVGNLSVTRVAPSATWDPNEAYRGPEYGEPIVHTDSRGVTLVFPGAALPADQNAEIRLSASTSIDREDFPQFFAELKSSNTPGVVVDGENCTIPSTVGEDYSGLICTGTPVVTTASGVITIALDLKLTRATSTASIASGAAGH